MDNVLAIYLLGTQESLQVEVRMAVLYIWQKINTFIPPGYNVIRRLSTSF